MPICTFSGRTVRERKRKALSLKKKTQLRIASFALAAVLLSGCSYRSQTEGNSSEPSSNVSYETEEGSVRDIADTISEEVFYNAEKIQLSVPEPTLPEGWSLFNTSFYSPVFVGDYLFTYVNRTYEITSEGPEGIIIEPYNEDFWAFFDLDGQYVGELTGENLDLPGDCYFHAEENGFVAVYNCYDYDRDNGEQSIYKVDFDLSGQMTRAPRVIHSEQDAYIDHVLFAENGHILCSYGNRLINLDASEKVLSGIGMTEDRTCAGIWEEDGKYYVQLRVHSDDSPDSYELYQLLYDANGMVSLSFDFRASDNLAGMHISQDNGKIYAATRNSIGTIDLASGKFGCLMDWNQTDYDRNILTSGNVKILSEGSCSSPVSVIAAQKDPGPMVAPKETESENSSIQASSTSGDVTTDETTTASKEVTRLCIAEIESIDMENPNCYLIYLTPAEKNPHNGQKQIWIGGVGISSSPITKSISQYNADTTHAAWIKLYDYADFRLNDYKDFTFYRNAVEQDMPYEINPVDSLKFRERATDNMESQINAGIGPDIIVSSGDSLTLGNSDYLTDLNPYIRSIHGIDTTKFFTNVLEAFEVNGSLYQLPLYVRTYALLGNSCYTDGKDKMNYHDLSLAQAMYSDNMMLFAEQDTARMMKLFLEGELTSWVDYERGSVTIDQNSLIDMLELLKVSTIYGYYSDSELEPAMQDPSPFRNIFQLADWVSIFCSASTNTYEEYMQYQLFGGHIQWFGYPGSKDCSMLAESDLTIGITSYSTQKELAWEIITYLLSDDAQLNIAQTIKYGPNGYMEEKIPININAFRTLNSKYKNTPMYGNVYNSDYPELEYSDDLLAEYEALLSTPKRRYATDATIYDIVRTYFERYMSGEMTVTQAAATIEEKIKSALSS